MIVVPGGEVRVRQHVVKHGGVLCQTFLRGQVRGGIEGDAVEHAPHHVMLFQHDIDELLDGHARLLTV